MRTLNLAAIATAALVTTVIAQAAKEASVEKRLVETNVVLNEMMKADDKGIPQDLLGQAQCVVVIPGLKKAGFVVGGAYGKGFAVCHKPGGTGWTAPASVRIEGGSFGLQIGAYETDLILIVKNESGMKKLLEDKFTLGGDASAAAGPLGRSASAQTDAQMRAEILSYSRSRGVFAGLTLTGATLRPDNDDNLALYGKPVTNKEILAGEVTPPAAASALETSLSKFAARKSS
jgi:lipid-binding SYLF domain-containing protein